MVQPPRYHLHPSIKMTNAKHAATETRTGGNCQIMRGSTISGNVWLVTGLSRTVPSQLTRDSVSPSPCRSSIVELKIVVSPHIMILLSENIEKDCSLGWGRWGENLQRRKKKGHSYQHCLEDYCEFKDRMEKHEKHKHSKDPPKNIMFTCDGCGFKTPLKSRMMRHSKTCLCFIALKERVEQVSSLKALLPKISYLCPQKILGPYNKNARKISY